MRVFQRYRVPNFKREDGVFLIANEKMVAICRWQLEGGRIEKLISWVVLREKGPVTAGTQVVISM